MTKKVIARTGQTAWDYDASAPKGSSDDNRRNTAVHLVLYAVGIGVFAVTAGHALVTVISTIVGQRTRPPYMVQVLLTLALGILAGFCADPAIASLRRNWATLQRFWRL
jgi:hypothetical protein